MDYKKSGVNIDAGNLAVKLIKNEVAKTHNLQVLNGIGSFGAFYQLPTGYKEPVLVSSTDGVGTKLILAIEANKFDTVGIDLVAMSVNDLICSGAKPLFFLDYIACHQLIPEQIKIIIEGMVEGCLQADCALVGGEMAEMNDLYRKGDIDLAGFAVGIVEKSKIIDGSKIKPGDNIYGLTSSGIHSNGYSLARKVMTSAVRKKYNVSSCDLLKPTKIYAKTVLNLLAQGKVLNGICHITGGGLLENLPRIFPKDTLAVIEKKKIPSQEIFSILQKAGNIADVEMYRVFNMGIGMVIITPDKLTESKELIKIGQIQSGNREVKLV